MQMTPSRIAALAVGVPVALALIGATGYSFVALAAQGTVQLSTAVALNEHGVTADINGGDVLLKQASVTGAELTGTGHYSLFRPVLSVTHTATGTNVNYRCPSMSGTCDLNATLQVPLRTAVTLSTEGGDVTAPLFSGDLTVLSGGGNVTAGNVTGTVLVQTDGGDLDADSLSGSLRFQTGGGDLNANTVSGSTMLQAGTDGGDVTVQTMSDPDANISSGGGDVTLTFAQVPRDLQISSDGGDILVVLPPGSTAYDIQATTDGGDLSVSHSVPSNPHSTNALILSSGGGDITVSEGS